MKEKRNLPDEQTLFPRKLHDAVGWGESYPAPYRVGMSNLGFQWVTWRGEQEADIATERFFHDPRSRLAPRALESGRAAAEFHILAFSVSHSNSIIPQSSAFCVGPACPRWRKSGMPAIPSSSARRGLGG